MTKPEEVVGMRIAMLSPIAWRTPPQHDGPWEQAVSFLTEGLVRKGIEVTLFATADSATAGRLDSVCPRPWEEDSSLIPKVWEGLHIAHVMEQAASYDIIHNHFDFLPITYSGLVSTPMVTTIHGFLSPGILPVYRKYNGRTDYVSISDADRHPDLDYLTTVYYGIDLGEFTFNDRPGDYLLFFGRIHHDKGTHEAIQAAKRAGMNLIIAGIVQDEAYFKEKVAPELDGSRIKYIGPVGQPEKTGLLGGAYALLHLIDFDEPFGLSLVEAMACGTPVVAFRRGAIPEIIEDGRTGFIVEDLDGVSQGLQRIAEIDRRDCRAFVEDRFTREQMVEGYINVYRTMYEGSGGSARKGHRPWGSYTVLEDRGTHKVKRIEVLPSKRLSYQKHQRRAEHWTVVRGQARVTINGKGVDLQTGQSVDVPRGAAHRIANTGKDLLTFVEVQRGDYLGEDDIIRLEDDYGRTDRPDD